MFLSIVKLFANVWVFILNLHQSVKICDDVFSEFYLN